MTNSWSKEESIISFIPETEYKSLYSLNTLCDLFIHSFYHRIYSRRYCKEYGGRDEVQI